LTILLAWIIVSSVYIRRLPPGACLVQPSAASATVASLVRLIRDLSSIVNAMDGFIRHDGSNRV